MAKLTYQVPFLLGALVLPACGGGDESEDEAQRSESSADCEDVCNFWTLCNNAEPNESACAQFCDDQADNVDAACLDLYVARMSCEADQLDCSGNTCQAERSAHFDCEAGP